MNCHQILSGACNAGDKCFAIGSVEGISFTAYAAGCNVVILASTFERVQIIPGATHEYVKISAIDCSTDTGKIAAAYENKICIFEPTPVVQSNKLCSHFLHYRWVQTGSFLASSVIITLSWNLEGTRLLTGGSTIQLWKERSIEHRDNIGVKFEIGEERENQTPTTESPGVTSWHNIWSCQTATSIYHMAFSQDGTLFATCGRNDRLVKIWYENKQVLFPSRDTSKNFVKDDTELNFTYVYIAHPRAVTQLSWRKTSKCMPRGSVSNMIVTSCLDNICRIWIETVLPDDGLVNMTQFDPLASQNPKFRTHRHKHRFMQRLKHMKTCFHIRRHAKNEFGVIENDFNRLNRNGPIPSLPSSCSVHDFHSYGYHGTGVSPGMHFHLAASINAETDIPLVPSMQTSNSTQQNIFILHWLNNKEMYFTLQAENIIQELTKKVINEENSNFSSNNASESIDPKKMEDLTGHNSPLESKSEYKEDGSVNDEHEMKNSFFPTSMSNTSSVNSLGDDKGIAQLNQLTDSLDIKIECLLRDWHQSPDLLFAIHPVDGSYLIWLIEWLDDYYPGSYRQAQVSFSTRIPSAFPLGDSTSMSTTVSLYSTGSQPLTLKDITNNVKGTVEITKEADNSDNEKDSTEAANKSTSENKTKKSDDYNESVNFSSALCPSVSMVTKHSNGTLNLWQLTFAFKTKFTQVLSIGHICRASGHRFRVNDITCHPVLPLLVSTSHHNLPEANKKPTDQILENSYETANRDVFTPSGFCSELILWKVDPVGPLCHSGGVSELARINSPEISAFSNVAWIPTLLPSTSLGGFSNSPSACFVASDGENLRIYQAVIDARSLLAEISLENALRPSASCGSLYSNASSSIPIPPKRVLHEHLKVVSQQSTARPGCLIQLDAISNAKHDWQNTQFLHVFQEQLITGDKSSSSNANDDDDNETAQIESNLDAFVDLRNSTEFEENFYIVIIEKTVNGSTLHMWRITISSKKQTAFPSESAMYVPDSNLTQEIDDADLAASHLTEKDYLHLIREQETTSHISITTEKVCTQELPLPDGVDVVHASPAAGHLSSSSIYPACYAPYVIVTACSDSIARFWKCNASIDNKTNNTVYYWSEWKMFSKLQESAIEIPGQPLNISAAYSGRIACAYKYGKSFTRPHRGDTESRYINLCVAIYECESSGGSEWVLEDTIHLKNIHLPRINIDQNIDLSYLHDNRLIQRKQRLNQMLQTITHEDHRSPRSGETTPELAAKTATGLLAVPSFSTLQSLRKSIAENGNTCPLTQKHLVQLDWVSKEDGSHILTVAVGSKILLYTPVSSDIAQANIKAMKESRSANRPILRKASSLAQTHFNDEIRWMKVRQVDLKTADGLPPLPMQISWVRDGILVVAMDSEMHVYSQWKPRLAFQHNVEDMMDTRNLRDEDLRTMANEATSLMLKTASSVPLMSKMSAANLQLFSNDKKKKYGSVCFHPQASSDGASSADYMPDFGLFQASRIACPVLPQYHPKQLMELLNCGKIRWVKAILAHLVRCMSGSLKQDIVADGEGADRQRSWSRSRTLSISYIKESGIQNIEHRGSATQIPEELMLDYAEINSIPPLPLWILLFADKEAPGVIASNAEDKKDYDELFELKTSEENLDDLLDEDIKYDRKASIPDVQSTSYFGPRQGQLLSRLLTHTHLPGLSSLDQMHLLALADTVASCNSDLTEKLVIDSAKANVVKDASGNPSAESLDDCGLRFLLAMKHFTYLLRCLPLNQRAQFQKNGIGTSNIVWAFHSESEEDLLNLIPGYNKDIKWTTLRELGVGYWLRNINTLRQCVERLAKCAYQSKQEPLDAAIYYLAMKKKSIVWGLFRSKRDEKMTAFFANNFSEDRWRKAALKNAFVLLGKQRFDHAVAFFLLANALKDAVEVCINKLEDFQLALIICRLYEGDLDISCNSMYKNLLYEHVLGFDKDMDKFDVSKAHPDPFLRSMTYWIFKKYQESLNTLLLNNVGLNHPSYKDDDNLRMENPHKNPNVFNFYIYLRTQPLLVRQNLALSAQEKKVLQVVLCGFTHSGDQNVSQTNDRQIQVEDTITATERQLYFTTAHAHFKAGCPVLALEVLNKLPNKILDSALNTDSEQNTVKKELDLINTGTFNWGTATTTTTQEENVASSFDWGASGYDNKNDDKFEIKWDDEDEEDDDDQNAEEIVTKNSSSNNDVDKQADVNNKDKSAISKIDVMAQQLKFVACLKILMEELSTLATGFEVDGGQLRYQLYVWLEKEVEALKHLCNYRNTDIIEETTGNNLDNIANTSTHLDAEKTTLHDILTLEKQDFEAKVMRLAKRKRWLKANETLLRTFLSYCALHGASGGGLASVRMELVLLLQELQQEKTQQQLLSPLPFPTTLPLLSACVAGNKTVIADPIKYLQSQTVDMLQCIVAISPFPILEPASFCEICVLRDLAIALSSCIYQSLCDSESFVVSKSKMGGYQSPGIENIARLNSTIECSYLIGNANAFSRKRILPTDDKTQICTSPSKWPGVTNLRALLAREKDEDIPKLNVFLIETFIATYMSLTIYAVATCDSRILYRLVGKNFTQESWSSIFGGGLRKLLRKGTTHNQTESFIPTQSVDEPADEGAVWNTVASITKQRVRLNMKILGSLGNTEAVTNMKEDKPTYREQFMPPEMSMISFFLSKPEIVDYDEYNSDDSNESESEDEDDVNAEINSTTNSRSKRDKDNNEHLNPLSYSWCILRLVIFKLIAKKMHDFLNIAGIEMQDLPVLSPLSHEIFRSLDRWQSYALEVLTKKGPPPEDFIPGFSTDSGQRLAIHRHRSILNKENTPFSSRSSSGPIRRLWNYLIRQEPIQDLFIKVLFSKRNESILKNDNVDNGTEDGSNYEATDNIRIIHKDHESIFAFCLNNNTPGTLAIANPREIVELDISLLLEAPHWYEDECDYDLLNISKETEMQPTPGFLVIQTSENSINNHNSELSMPYTPSLQSGRGTSVILRHKVDNVKRMSSHPLMPLYITGGQDGSVQIWEWNHQQVVCTPRSSGAFAKVTRCRFSEHGNKFGIGDGDGNLSLWQAGLASQNNKAFFTHQCHSKILSDFVFLGSCSLLATGGQSSENKNVSIWDTLLPQRKSCISAFTCHEQGASSVVFAPQHQLLLSCGKKGDVCIFDLRQRMLKHRFQAHDTTIKCLALDPHEEFFATGSIEGDIKIWSLQQYSLINSFIGEHSKSSFFKHVGQGVNQIHIDNRGRLFSCGSDGCMKVRQLIEGNDSGEANY